MQPPPPAEVEAAPWPHLLGARWSQALAAMKQTTRPALLGKPRTAGRPYCSCVASSQHRPCTVTTVFSFGAGNVGRRVASPTSIGPPHMQQAVPTSSLCALSTKYSPIAHSFAEGRILSGAL